MSWLGNGYVGQAMVKQALKSGLDVVSINRSGSPRDFIAPRDASGTIDWVRGDIFTPSDWREVLHGAEGVISCVGAFGSNEVNNSSISMICYPLPFILSSTS